MLLNHGGDTPARLLIAEDDTLLAATLAEFLREEGHTVTLAANGEAALAAAQGLEFDVLLTDLRMPVMDGMALIRTLRVDRPELPVVVISGDLPADWRLAVGPTADGPAPLHLVTKPMTLSQLRAALAAVRRECAGA